MFAAGPCRSATLPPRAPVLFLAVGHCLPVTATRLQMFREYYFEQRHLQLMSDLTPPASMLESHRQYLMHITGFFIIEDKVLQSTRGLLTDVRPLPHHVPPPQP